jgi:hypothetical protein
MPGNMRLTAAEAGPQMGGLSGKCVPDPHNRKPFWRHGLGTRSFLELCISWLAVGVLGNRACEIEALKHQDVGGQSAND